MPFPFKHSKHTFTTATFSPSSAYTSPWHHPSSKNPVSPTTSLRRSFKAFTHAENMRRAERNEQPFCSPAGRDRAFEKLLRLARGEEELRWDIDEGWDEEEEWYAGFVKAQMEHAEKVGEMHVGQDDEGRKGKAKEHERKDSKEVVALKDVEGWGRVEEFGKVGDVDGQWSDDEHMEDINEDGKSAGILRTW
jgi:hypothetical protein